MDRRRIDSRGLYSGVSRMGEQVSSSSQIGDCRSSSKLLPFSCAGCVVAVWDRAAHWFTTRSNRAVNWRCGVPGSVMTPERLVGLVGVDVAVAVGVGVVGEAAGTVGSKAVVVVGGVRCCSDPCNRDFGVGSYSGTSTVAMASVVSPAS